MQKTIGKVVKIVGTGLHSGAPARLRIRPAAAGHGISFYRVDLPADINCISAHFLNVSDTTLNTRLMNEHGVTVSTVEHLMAALSGMGVTNAAVEIDGPEVPIMDGSAAVFAREIWRAGLCEQDAPLNLFEVTKSVYVEGKDGAFAALHPSVHPIIDFHINFPGTAIGSQSKSLDVGNGVFMRELADCRTFCKSEEVEMMRHAGLALGGSLNNAVVLEGREVVNKGGFRRELESVRHKMLDALGDLYMAGAPVLGRYVGYKAGHGLTNQLLRAAFKENAMISREASDWEVGYLPGSALVNRDFERVWAVAA